MLGQTGPAKEILEKADFLIDNTHYEEALVMLDEAIKREPNNANIFLKKANIQIFTLQFKEAIATLEEAVKMDDKHYQSYDMLGNLYFQSKDADKAAYYYGMAFKTDDNVERKLEYKLLILDILDKLNRHRFSARHIQDAKQIMGDNFDLKFYEVMYLNETNQFQQAADIMASLIEEVPIEDGNEQYYWQYGYALHNLGKYDEAKEVLKNANGSEYKARMHIFSAEYYYNLAQAYYKIYNYKKAQERLRIALDINPNYLKAIELDKILISISSEQSKLIEAQKQAVKVAKDPKRLGEQQIELARLYYNSDDYSNAHNIISEYLVENSRDIKNIFFQAIIEDKMEMRENAHTLLGKIVQSPKLSSEIKAIFYFALGVIYKNGGEFDKAQNALKEAYSGDFKDGSQYEFQEVMKLRQIKELEAQGGE